MSSPRIVIVGAGSSGIACATKLLEYGFENVLIVEAESRIGGRIHTIPFADNVVDMGAQWCHGEKDNLVYELVSKSKQNLLMSTGDVYENYECIRSNGEIVPDEISQRLKNIVNDSLVTRQMELRNCNGSLGSYLTNKFYEILRRPENSDIDRTIADEFFENYQKFEESVEGSDSLDEVSGYGYLEYWECEGDILLNWKDKGFTEFLRLLMKVSSSSNKDNKNSNTNDYNSLTNCSSGNTNNSSSYNINSNIEADNSNSNTKDTNNKNNCTNNNNSMISNYKINNKNSKNYNNNNMNSSKSSQNYIENTKSDFGILEKRILLNHPVRCIDWKRNDSCVQLSCKNGAQFLADHVILTMSLGVLKEQHSYLFEPKLPIHKLRPIEGLSFGTVNKIFMEFPEPFWPTNWTGFTTLWRAEDLIELRKSSRSWCEDIFGFYCDRNQSRLLSGWIIGANGRHTETLPEADVLDGCMYLLRKFLPWTIPEPCNFRRSTWFRNSYFRGSFSFRSMFTEEMGTSARELAEPLYVTTTKPITNERKDTHKGASEPQLFSTLSSTECLHQSSRCDKPIIQFAGEATSDHYYSTVHGAVESGWREALRLAQFYGKKGIKLSSEKSIDFGQNDDDSDQHRQLRAQL